jgi:hypothetical protein
MACEECRELTTHAFRSVDDLIHAVRLATEEVDRGVLAHVRPRQLEGAAQEALDSSLESGALPSSVTLKFQCNQCGDLFTLAGETASGAGGWTREGEEPPRTKTRPR